MRSNFSLIRSPFGKKEKMPAEDCRKNPPRNKATKAGEALSSPEAVFSSRRVGANRLESRAMGTVDTERACRSIQRSSLGRCVAENLEGAMVALSTVLFD